MVLVCKLGIELPLIIESDSSARAFSSRRGLGRQRHVQTGYLWIQDRIAKQDLSIVKVPADENVSDVLTKATSGPHFNRHFNVLGFRDVSRSALQKRV
eukprot:3967570-Heterocapsa_arctica.AAC.1